MMFENINMGVEEVTREVSQKCRRKIYEGKEKGKCVICFEQLFSL